MARRKKKSANKLSISDYAVLLFSLGLIFHFIQVLTSGHRRQQALSSSDTQLIVARINDEKKFLGNSPLSKEFYYKYSFMVGDEKFKGDSRRPDKKPGDRILVRYVVGKPEFNEPVEK
jgi:hypothetical protein